jgi:hypothetical protein
MKCYTIASMKKLLLIVLTFWLLVPTAHAWAIEDPLSHPNNKFGVHVLFDSELDAAARLVNTNGGDWGYVTIPIQAGDKDLDKWQHFMDKAREDHLIPIVRLATEGDYFNTNVWRKPDESDIIDFANFLNSLNWPTKNRYIIVFNEVNRGDEWGGQLDPTYYAQLLSYSVTVFKSINPDFFIISSGMDNAAPNQGTNYMDQYDFMRAMDEGVPGIFNQVDGVSSHSYPNPGFSQPPSKKTDQSISSFTYERDLLSKLTSKKLPIFITETGWSSQKVSDDDRAKYYQQAFQTIWNDPQIVAVTPFVLTGSGPFEQFTFIKSDLSFTKQYNAIKDMAKIKGEPSLTPQVLAAASEIAEVPVPKNFSEEKKTTDQTDPSQISKMLRATFGWVMKL